MVKAVAKKPTKPAVKPIKPLPALVAPKPPVTPPTPAAAPAPTPKPAPVAKVVNIDKENVQNAIAQGLALLKEGKSKADAARLIYGLLETESRDVVIEAFIHGATITPKGAPTYFYNVSRKFKREKARAESKPADPPQ